MYVSSIELLNLVRKNGPFWPISDEVIPLAGQQKGEIKFILQKYVYFIDGKRMLNFLKNRYIMLNKKLSMMNTGIIIPDFTVIDCIIVLGFKLSNATFRCLVLRFANQEGNIEFDDFVLCAVRLKSMYGRC